MECSERVVLPTELAGHGDVQPSPLRFFKNRVTDPDRFGFCSHFPPILLADTKIVADSALNAEVKPDYAEFTIIPIDC